VMAAPHTPDSLNWSVMRALRFSSPNAVILKDLLPDAENTVVFQNTQYPIRRVVADRLSRGGNPSRKLLVQFTEEGYEDSAWIKEKFVPRRFVEEFEQRQDQEDPPELHQD